MRQLRRRIRDKRLLASIWKMLRAGVLEDMQYAETTAGYASRWACVPAPGEYLHAQSWTSGCTTASIRCPAINDHRNLRHGELASVRYIRYADDFIILMRKSDKAEQLKQELADFIAQELKMTLSFEKTAITKASNGFDFLGVCTSLVPKRSNPNKLLPFQYPAKTSVRHIVTR